MKNIIRKIKYMLNRKRLIALREEYLDGGLSAVHRDRAYTEYNKLIREER